MATHPLIAIVGETASGKSALALVIAERFNGEIICADSRTVYEGMDIGTAKPSYEDRARVPHHLLDAVSPKDNFNVSMFQRMANKVIEEIQLRGKLPVLVCGTGLYIDSVLYKLDIKAENTERNALNPRHLNSAGFPSVGKILRPNTLVIGLSVPKDELEVRINRRVKQMLGIGLEQEVKTLAKQYGWEAAALTGVGYREWQQYFESTQTLEETKQLIATHTRQYAKRQRTWFKRNKHIKWVDSQEAAQEIVMTFLQRL
ncbi:tRNA (adenosine(37)-N6)-dimethylallyltransferase MiaA [soil metagenome]